MARKKGQSAIEFAVMIALLITLFILLFTFLSANILQLNDKTNYARLEVLANSLYDEILLVHASQSGYSRIIDTDDLYTREQWATIHNGTVIVTRYGTPYAFDEYVRFLPEERSVTGTFCRGVNEITKNLDRGVFVCCGECDFDFAYRIECGESIWGNCNGTATQGVPISLRSKCGLNSAYAQVEIWRQGAGTFLDETYNRPYIFEENTVWYWNNQTYDFSDGRYYNVTVECYTQNDLLLSSSVDTLNITA